jgi:hypothetical protein
LKVAVLSPTVLAIYEKMAVLFPDEGIDVVGPRIDDNPPERLFEIQRRVREWAEVGLQIRFVDKPYSEIDFSGYDLLIETVETFQYAEDWKNHCTRVECPIIVSSCWYDSPRTLIPSGYIEAVRKFPVVVQMPANLAGWRASPFADVTAIVNPVGEWYFDEPWTGDNGKALYVLAGKDLWRPADKRVLGLDIVERLQERFPSRILHHDGAVNYLTPKELGKLYASSRVFLQLDDPDSGRPLCGTFTEAVAVGCPVLTKSSTAMDYTKYVNGNGLMTNDFEQMCTFINLLFTDDSLAQIASHNGREIGREHFSYAAVRPQYDALIHRAQEAFRSR